MQNFIVKSHGANEVRRRDFSGRFLSAAGWPRVRGTDPRTCDLASLPQGRGTPPSVNDGFKMRRKTLEDDMESRGRTTEILGMRKQLVK